MKLNVVNPTNQGRVKDPKGLFGISMVTYGARDHTIIGSITALVSIFTINYY